jgi:four helix bundle protein
VDGAREFRFFSFRTDRILVQEGGVEMRDHRKLEIFRLADELAISVYRQTRAFPRSERFGLVSQLRRGAVSAAANIVEGCGRRSEADFDRFLDFALGSAREVGYLIDLSTRLGMFPRGGAAIVIDSEKRLTGALVRFVQSRERFRDGK